MARIRKSVFDELERVRKLISEKFPDFEFRNLAKTLGRLGTFHYRKKKGLLLGRERELYNLLIENSYNPYTVYKWALLERVPDDIRFQLRNHYVSQKKASLLSFKRRHETENSLQVDIKRLGLQIIRGM